MIVGVAIKQNNTVYGLSKHTWVDGYRARVKGIPRDHNWFEEVRPNTTDSVEWFAGWDKAENDLGIGG